MQSFHKTHLEVFLPFYEIARVFVNHGGTKNAPPLAAIKPCAADKPTVNPAYFKIEPFYFSGFSEKYVFYGRATGGFRFYKINIFAANQDACAVIVIQNGYSFAKRKILSVRRIIAYHMRPRIQVTQSANRFLRLLLR